MQNDSLSIVNSGLFYDSAIMHEIRKKNNDKPR